MRLEVCGENASAGRQGGGRWGNSDRAVGVRRQGETVPYIICVDQGQGGEGAAGSGGSKGLAQRAYHMDEIREAGSQLMPDAAYYLGHQARALPGVPTAPHLPGS